MTDRAVVPVVDVNASRSTLYKVSFYFIKVPSTSPSAREWSSTTVLLFSTLLESRAEE
jgi:hypothetical protein